MTRTRAARTWLLTAGAALALHSAWAGKPEWAGGHRHGQGEQRDKHHDKRDKHDKHDRRDDDRRWNHRGNHQGNDDDRGRRHRGDRDRRHADRPGHGPVVVIAPGSYFNDSHRRHARDWYGQQVRTGHCPPGLAKKHSGCMPPGQARKWAVGRSLPAGVAYYAVPQPVLVQLGPPPAGYRYGRVANDIVLMPVGSRLVVDAIIDLGQLF